VCQELVSDGLILEKSGDREKNKPHIKRSTSFTQGEGYKSTNSSVVLGGLGSHRLIIKRIRANGREYN